MKKCKNCGNIITNSDSRNIFCSRSCSATYNNSRRKHTEETRRKIRYSIQRARADGISKTPTEGKGLRKVINVCISCSKPFEARKKPNQKCCSVSCKTDAYNRGLYDLKGKSGGYRKGSGRGKSGWYNGIWCDSSYELAWVMYHLDHNIPFERNQEPFQYEYNGKIHLYYPDFRLKDGDELVEIKGFYNEQTYAKLKSVVKTKLTILGKEEMVKYIDYAKEKYGEKFVSLYEGNPHNKMTNTCKSCGNPCMKKSVYCSRQCAGRGNNRNSNRKSL